MKVTFNHPDSRHGFPVILNDAGERMPDAEGLEAGLRMTGISKYQFCGALGVSASALYSYGRNIRMPANVLNLLGLLLEAKTEKQRMAVLKLPRRSPDEARVFKMHEVDGLSFAEIGRRLSLTRERVRQVYNYSQAKMP